MEVAVAAQILLHQAKSLAMASEFTAHVHLGGTMTGWQFCSVRE